MKFSVNLEVLAQVKESLARDFGRLPALLSNIQLPVRLAVVHGLEAAILSFTIGSKIPWAQYENAQSSLVIIHEEDAEEWALYLKTIFKHLLSEDRILLYNMGSPFIHPLGLPSLGSYRCKLLILSSGLVNCLNKKKRRFLDKILQPPERVVVLLCGIESSDAIYQILNIDPHNPLITTNHDPEVYLAVITGIIQQDEALSLDLKRSLKLENHRVETEATSETLESPAVLLLPTRISCENPGEIFVLLRGEVPDDSVVIEFVTENKWIRTEPHFWSQKVRYMKALDFPAGFVNVNVYCEGVIKASTQIEYYTAVEEIESILQKVADPIVFACQASKFSSAEKVDNLLTFLLKSPIISHNFSAFPNEVMDHHRQTDSHLEELPTLLHCAAKFGLKKLTAFLLQCPDAIRACGIANKYRENPACIAEKYGYKEIQKIITELSIKEDSKESNNQEEEEVETVDDTYVVMMSSESLCNGLSLAARPNPREQPGACWKIQKDSRMVGDGEEQEREAKTGEEEEENKLGGNPQCSSEEEEEKAPKGRSRNVVYPERPPLPPRIPLTTARQDEVFNWTPEWEAEKEQKKTDEIHEKEKEEGESEKSEEEDPYSSALVDDGVYDIIFDNDNKERRKGGRSFIMNRPPAPAPRPLFAPTKEESTPYIAQVFQQKATRTHAGNEKLLCAARKPDKAQGERTTYSTVKPSIPLRQEELILLQEQVKKGILSVDEALEKFKEWQNHRSGLEATQQEKIRQLRDSIIRKRPEEESTYDKITIIHHPDVPVARRKASLSAEGIVYTHPFPKQTLL
ncbi:B-cell scaffold protein with ankyrin repeats [Podarcis raffonei]|uniref:B-cell scaffold protein with ankyrin repeats n=1 Tax=Podarcis raffonei TaxID=65483 RepID=UPI0023298AAE|nr:B-cell scaffold protein with ankyrin repeats [Podarcis raffonei]